MICYNTTYYSTAYHNIIVYSNTYIHNDDPRLQEVEEVLVGLPEGRVELDGPDVELELVVRAALQPDGASALHAQDAAKVRVGAPVLRVELDGLEEEVLSKNV